MSSILERLAQLVPLDCPTPIQFKGNKISFLYQGAMFRYEMSKRVYPDMLLTVQNVIKLNMLIEAFSDSEPTFKLSNGYLVVSTEAYSYPIKLAKDFDEYDASEEVILKPVLTAEYAATLSNRTLTDIASVLDNDGMFSLQVLSGQMLLTCNSAVFMLPGEHNFPDNWRGFYRVDGLKRWATQIETQLFEVTLSVGLGLSPLMLKTTEINLTTVMAPGVVEPIN